VAAVERAMEAWPRGPGRPTRGLCASVCGPPIHRDLMKRPQAPHGRAEWTGRMIGMTRARPDWPANAIGRLSWTTAERGPGQRLRFAQESAIPGLALGRTRACKTLVSARRRRPPLKRWVPAAPSPPHYVGRSITAPSTRCRGRRHPPEKLEGRGDPPISRSRAPKALKPPLVFVVAPSPPLRGAQAPDKERSFSWSRTNCPRRAASRPR